MRIALLFNQDLISCFALNIILPKLKNKHSVHLFYSDSIGASLSSLPNALQAMSLKEQEFITHILESKTNSLTTKDDSKIKLTQFRSIETLSECFQCPMQALNDINKPSGLKKLRQLTPDLMLSIRFGKILKADAIAIPKLGILNLHSGILPNYQGVMATFWAMLNQDKEYGSTLHWIDSVKIDSGPIIKINRHPLDCTRSYFENTLSLYPRGCESMLSAVNHLENNQTLELEPKPDNSTPKYFSFPTDADIEIFLKLGMDLLPKAGFKNNFMTELQ